MLINMQILPFLLKRITDKNFVGDVRSTYVSRQQEVALRQVLAHFHGIVCDGGT